MQTSQALRRLLDEAPPDRIRIGFLHAIVFAIAAMATFFVALVSWEVLEFLAHLIGL